MSTSKSLKCLIVMVFSVLGLLLLYDTSLRFQNNTIFLQLPPHFTMTSSQLRQCDDVLNNMLRGRWIQRKMTPQEVDRMRRFHKRVREVEHHMPRGMQRPDGRCGDVSMGTGGTLSWFRGLCDPFGPKPCCFNNRCANKTTHQCVCPNCFDMRTPIQAEYATWRPVEPTCEPHSWSVREICDVLGNASLHFFGDSLVRHIYTAFLLAITGNPESGAFSPKMPENLAQRCSGIYMFTEKVCRKFLAPSMVACGGNVRLRFSSFSLVSHAPRLFRVCKSLRRTQERSLVFAGAGFHERLNAELMKSRVLIPLVNILQATKPQKSGGSGNRTSTTRNASERRRRRRRRRRKRAAKISKPAAKNNSIPSNYSTQRPVKSSKRLVDSRQSQKKSEGTQLSENKDTQTVPEPPIQLVNTSWPRLLWAGIHKFGILRTPLTDVTNNKALVFNRKMKEFLEPRGVPVFDMFNLTDNVMSFDGQHFGYGMNSMKVTILLHYIQELKSQGLW